MNYRKLKKIYSIFLSSPLLLNKDFQYLVLSLFISHNATTPRPSLCLILYKQSPYQLVLIQADESSGCAVGSIHNRTTRCRYYHEAAPLFGLRISIPKTFLLHFYLILFQLIASWSVTHVTQPRIP